MKKTETVACRIDKNLKTLLEKFAESRGETISTVINSVLSEQLPIASYGAECAQDYVKTVERYFEESTGKPLPYDAILNLIVMNFLAQNAAEVESFGKLELQENHFVFSSQGKLLVSDELFDFLKKRYLEKFEKLNQFVKAVEMLDIVEDNVTELRKFHKKISEIVKHLTGGFAASGKPETKISKRISFN